MAKNSWLGLLEPDPDKAWKEAGKKPKDTTARVRSKLMAGIQNTISQLEKLGPDDAAPARAWFKFRGNMAQVTLKRGTKILPIAGRDKNVVPRERAVDFYRGALTAVENGELDADLGEQTEARPRGGRGRRSAK